MRKPSTFTARIICGTMSVILFSACDLQASENLDAGKTTIEKIILQDGVDAFSGYQSVEIPTVLNEMYPGQGPAILAFLKAFNLRALANTQGVSAWAKIRTSTAGETTWEYELAYLPDDAVYATGYKIYLEDVNAAVRIARIGHRVKCRRGQNPKQWTAPPCP